MRALGSVTSLSWLVALLAACSSSPASAGGEARGTVGDQCDAIAAAYCDHAADCRADASAMPTVRAQCTELGTTLCARAVTCGTQSSRDACLASFLGSCCDAEGLCDAPATSAETDLAPCNAGIAEMTCYDVKASNLPVACVSVVKAAVTTTTDAECRTESVALCCARAGKCVQPASSSAATVDACVQALAAASCAPALPDACRGAVQIAASVVSLDGEKAIVSPSVADFARRDLDH